MSEDIHNKIHLFDYVQNSKQWLYYIIIIY